MPATSLIPTHAISADGSAIVDDVQGALAVLLVVCRAAPTGGTPTLKFKVEYLDPNDETTVMPVWIDYDLETAAIAGIENHVLQFQPNWSSKIRVSWDITGAGTFGDIDAYLIVFDTQGVPLKRDAGVSLSEIRGIALPTTAVAVAGIGVDPVDGLSPRLVPIQVTQDATNLPDPGRGVVVAGWDGAAGRLFMINALGQLYTFGPISGTDAGGNDVAARAHDLDTGAGGEFNLGASIRLPGAGGSVAGGTATNPIRVDPTGTTTQPVSGTVTAGQGSPASGANRWPVAVTDTADAVVRPGDAANNAVRVNVVAGSSGGPSKTDDTAFGVASDAVAPMGAMFDDASPDSVDEGDVGVVRMTATRDLHANLRANDGTEIGTSGAPLRVDPTGTTTQPVSDGGGSLTIDAASLPLPTGAATESTLSTLNGKVPSQGQAAMAASVPVAIASNQSGVPVTDNGGSLTVDGTVGVSGTVAENLSQVGGNAVSVGSGVLGTGTQRVVLATDQPVVRVAEVGTRAALGRYSVASGVVSGSASAQNLFSLENPSGSGRTVYVRKLYASAGALAVANVVFALSMGRTTAVPSGGTTLTAQEKETAGSSPSGIARQAPTATAATGNLWSSLGPGTITAVGEAVRSQYQILYAESELDEIVLAPGEGILVSAAGNDTDMRFVVGAEWYEV